MHHLRPNAIAGKERYPVVAQRSRLWLTHTPARAISAAPVMAGCTIAIVGRGNAIAVCVNRQSIKQLTAHPGATGV
jgi:hypothetical protein